MTDTGRLCSVVEERTQRIEALLDSDTPTHLSHVVTSVRQAHSPQDLSYAEVIDFLEHSAPSSYLGWLIRHGLVKRAVARMTLRTSTLPRTTQGAEPGITTFVSAAQLFPADKELLLCILRHLPQHCHVSEHDNQRLRDVVLELMNNKADMLVIVALLSVVHPYSRHHNSSSVLPSSSSLSTLWGADLWRALMRRTDLSFQQRRAWMTIVRHCFRTVLGTLEMGHGEWMEWVMDAAAGLTATEQAKMLQWRLDDGAKGRPGNRVDVFIPHNETQSQKRTRRQLLHGLDSSEHLVDVNEFEIARDIERGRPAQEACDAAAKRRANATECKYDLPWGQKKVLEPRDAEGYSNIDSMTGIARIRWFLERKIFRPQSLDDHHWTRQYLEKAAQWFEWGGIETQEEFEALKADFPQYVTDEIVGVGSLTHLNWLAKQGKLEQVRARLNQCTSYVLQSLFDPSSAAVYDFLLEALYERPELVDQEDQCGLGLHDSFLHHAPPVMIFFFYVLGGATQNEWRSGCESFIDGHRLPGSRFSSATPMSLNERWAMVQVMLTQFQRGGSELWYERILSEMPKEERPFWLEWSVSRSFQRDSCSVTRSLLGYGSELLPWFRAQYFRAPNLSEWFGWMGEHLRSKPDVLIDAITTADRLWSGALNVQSRQFDFMLLAIKARNMPLVHFCEVRGLKLRSLDQALRELATPDHAIKCRKNYNAWIRPELEEAHFSVLRWVFKTQAADIATLYNKAKVSEYGGNTHLPSFDEKLSHPYCSDRPLSVQEQKTYEWVQANCITVREYVQRCNDAIAERKRREEEVRVQRQRQQEEADARRRDYDYDYDYDYYDYDD